MRKAMHALNPQQLAAIKYIDGPLLVVAGAGSGKTSVITHKIQYLIQQCNIKPSHILAVTFTNKAAREMAKRVTELLKGTHTTKGMMISTFHTFGLKFIRTEHTVLGFKSNLSIFDREDSLNLIRELLVRDTDEHKEKLEIYLNHISNFKSNALEPHEALAIAKTELEHAAAKLYAEYQKQLKIYNAVDFDDLILLPLKALTKNSDLLEKWQNNIRYFLVDEYQDTNKSQYALIHLLAGVQGRLTVVGDDHQSIYAWRGAKSDNWVRLKHDYPHLNTIMLEQNYRSTSIILRAANHLISHNNSFFEKNLWSQLGLGESIRVLYAKDDEHEANRVVVHLLSHQFQNRTEYRDYAILYRNNHQSRILEKTLREHRIPYQVSGGTAFFSRTEVKDIVSYLKLLVNPEDDCAFLRIANVPRREIGPSTLEKLGLYAKSRHISLFEASFEIGLEQTLTGKPLERLRHFTHWLNLVMDNAKRGDTIAVIQEMVKTINYEGWLVDTCQHPKTAERKMENVHELIAWLTRLLEGDATTPQEPKTLAEVVQTLVLIDILERTQDEKPANCVQLMTLHAAKGLEFPHVFLVGLEEELLPHRTSIEEDNVEEERRLAYVGMTRAKKTLTLSLAKHRKRFNEMIDCIPSRFLEELPKEDVIWDGKTESDPASSAQTGRAHLSAIRAMLAQS